MQHFLWGIPLIVKLILNYLLFQAFWIKILLTKFVPNVKCYFYRELCLYLTTFRTTIQFLNHRQVEINSLTIGPTYSRVLLNNTLTVPWTSVPFLPPSFQMLICTLSVVSLSIPTLEAVDKESKKNLRQCQEQTAGIRKKSLVWTFFSGGWYHMSVIYGTNVIW